MNNSGIAYRYSLNEDTRLIHFTMDVSSGITVSADGWTRPSTAGVGKGEELMKGTIMLGDVGWIMITHINSKHVGRIAHNSMQRMC